MANISPISNRLARFGLTFLVLIGGAVAYFKFTAPSAAQIPAFPPLPVPNGFDMYVAAATSLVPAKPPVDKINDIKRLTPQQAAVQYSQKRRRAWIATNAVSWQKMAEAKALPSHAPNMRGNLNMHPGWAPLRELARAQHIRTKEAKASGQWGEAANLGIDSLEMGINVERGSNLMGALVSMAIQAIALSSLEDVPSHLDAVQAKTASKRLETLLDNAQPFAKVLTEEKWNLLANMNGNNPMGTTAGSARIMSLYMPHASANTSAMMDKFIAEADKPVGSQAAVPPPRGVLSTFSSLLYPSTQKSFFNDARRKANERLLLLRLALRAYRVEHGSYPARLSALAPTYLKSVPVDPFGTGEPLRYKVNGDSYMAWSIGPDRLENNGVSIPLKPGKERVIALPESKGDIVVKP